MRLSELLDGLGGVRALPSPGGGRAPDPAVTGVTFDSRRARPGTLFLAVAGSRLDGRRFAAGAVAAGAVAVVSDGGPPGPDAPGVPWFVADDLRDLSGRLVARLHAADFAAVPVWAVTGTKGKTTTTRMLAAIFGAAGRPCGSVGTLGWRGADGAGGPLANTTPDAARLGEIVAALRAAGDVAVAVEASSQAGVQARLRHLPLAGLAFLNLSPEHAELHPTMAEYRAAKAALFADAAAARPDLVVAVPAGCPDGAVMAAAAGPAARVRTFAEGADPAAADLVGRVVGGGLARLDLELAEAGEAVATTLAIGGRFNLQNALAAASLARAAGVSLADVGRGLAALPGVRGRFEVLEHAGRYAMVDYAHSADSLEKLLLSCREVVAGGRLLVVFGCGGKKDEAKRPKMGASAAAHGDLVWVTNDNPRGEDPGRIAGQILAGVGPGSQPNVRVILDRRAAIRAALEAAGPGDLVVVAGKGHETEQDLGDRVIEFDDREEIRRFWAEA